MRGPKQDQLKAVEQSHSRLRECIDEAGRLCEATQKLVRKTNKGKADGQGR